MAALASAVWHRLYCQGGAFSFTIWSGDAERDPFFEIVQQAVRKHGTIDAELPDGPNAFVLAQGGTCEAVMSDAGFGGIQRSEITVAVDLGHPEGILEIVATTVQMRSIVEAQAEDAQRLIRADIVEAAHTFERDGLVRMPMTGILFSARRGG